MRERLRAAADRDCGLRQGPSWSHSEERLRSAGRQAGAEGEGPTRACGASAPALLLPPRGARTRRRAQKTRNEEPRRARPEGGAAPTAYLLRAAPAAALLALCGGLLLALGPRASRLDELLGAKLALPR